MLTTPLSNYTPLAFHWLHMTFFDSFVKRYGENGTHESVPMQCNPTGELPLTPVWTHWGADKADYVLLCPVPPPLLQQHDADHIRVAVRNCAQAGLGREADCQRAVVASLFQTGSGATHTAGGLGQRLALRQCRIFLQVHGYLAPSTGTRRGGHGLVDVTRARRGGNREQHRFSQRLGQLLDRMARVAPDGRNRPHLRVRQRLDRLDAFGPAPLCGGRPRHTRHLGQPDPPYMYGILPS
eukprot:3892908-Prymnesium_polylepis.1